METSQAQLELSVIKKIMADSRNVVINNGWHYIYWGVLVAGALIANYVMALMKVGGQYQGMMWLVLMVGGAITEAIIERRVEKKRRVKTFAGQLLGSLWTASGISMFMFGFVGTMTHAYSPLYISPIISTLLGVSYFTSGAIQQIKWLQFLSIGWWAGAIVLFILPSVHTLIIFAGMMICFQTIPGIILYRKSKSESSEIAT